ncbi:hypothetical protein NL676_017415 [Syzygium grande]|nr:hypothetical protein NL676_017415 [Syzygium grande]
MGISWSGQTRSGRLKLKQIEVMAGIGTAVGSLLFVSIRVSSGEFVHLSGQESSSDPDPLIEGESRAISSLASVQVICEGHRAQTVVESRGAVARFALAGVASLLPWSTGPWFGYGSVASTV